MGAKYRFVLISPEAHLCGILAIEKINLLPTEKDILTENETLFDALIDKEALSLPQLDRLVGRLVKKDVLTV